MVIVSRSGVHKGKPFRFVLYSRSRNKVLGYHPSRGAALKQERAIQFFTHKSNPGNPVSKYATIRRGRVKVRLGSSQYKLLRARRLPHSIVTVNGGKRIKRVFPRRR